MVLVEEGSARVFEIEHSDDALFIEERNDEFGARFRIHREIALIFAHIGNIDGTPLAHGCADEPAGDGDAAHGRLRIAEAPCIARDQSVAFFVEKHDGEHLVVDEPAQELTDLREKRIDIEDRCELGGDFVEDGESLSLAGDACVEARILDGLRNARSRESEQMKMLRLEEIGLFALEIQDADEAVFGDERNGEFGADVGVGGNVALDLGDVVDEHGLTGVRDLPYDALAQREAHAVGFGRVADLEAHAEIVGAVVEQEDGEDAVRDDGADELRGAIE